MQIDNLFLDGVLHYKAIDGYRPGLANAVRAVRRLVLDGGVPPWIQMNHIVRSCEVKSLSTCSQADQEQVSIAGLERIDFAFANHRARAAVEVAIIAAVVAVAAVLVQFPTARQEAESAAFAEAGAEAVVGYEETRPAGDLSVNVSIAPNAVGTNSFQVFVFPPPGEDLSEILRVRLRFKPPDPSLGPSQVIAEREAPNFFRAVGRSSPSPAIGRCRPIYAAAARMTYRPSSRCPSPARWAPRRTAWRCR